MKINKCGCGGEGAVCSSGNSHIVWCHECRNRTINKQFEHEAITAWNTAHPDTTELTATLANRDEHIRVLERALSWHSFHDDTSLLDFGWYEVWSKYGVPMIMKWKDISHKKHWTDAGVVLFRKMPAQPKGMPYAD
jgi:hypothetical protein